MDRTSTLPIDYGFRYSQPQVVYSHLVYTFLRLPSFLPHALSQHWTRVQYGVWMLSGNIPYRLAHPV